MANTERNLWISCGTFRSLCRLSLFCSVFNNFFFLSFFDSSEMELVCLWLVTWQRTSICYFSAVFPQYHSFNFESFLCPFRFAAAAIVRFLFMLFLSVWCKLIFSSRNSSSLFLTNGLLGVLIIHDINWRRIKNIYGLNDIFFWCYWCSFQTLFVNFYLHLWCFLFCMYSVFQLLCNSSGRQIEWNAAKRKKTIDKKRRKHFTSLDNVSFCSKGIFHDVNEACWTIIVNDFFAMQL